MKETITRIPIATYCKTLKKMKKTGERWRKMAEVVYAICIIDIAEDIVLDLVMIKALQEENIT
ncbi:uncharacterized protein [Drosophila takahashii]|uniref:uncharacterized protein n=1 Tax=Drosophila takahashii TaxID=29030 RepID=UPI001CF8A791|nr:uncharacterized protein LOC108068366 [Drosophila takahashii]